VDRESARRIIESCLAQPFAEDRFRLLAVNLLEGIDEDKEFNWVSGQYIRDAFKDHVRKYRRLGTYTDPDGRTLDVLVVHLKNPWALERSRATQRNFVAEYLRQRGEKDAALIAYHVDDPANWRFSFVRMQYREEVTEDGRVKVKEEFTPSRRYSFLVGQNEPSHTARQQLVPLLEEVETPTLDEIERTFSVERVTKEFYTDYRGLFEKARAALDSIVEKNKRVRDEFARQSIDPANFAKKLLGQIVFLYFLQKKGWLGVGRDEAGDFRAWGQGPRDFLRRLYEKQFGGYRSFFDEILEPLFYEALATERPDDVYTRFSCRIPFLNGGLFEPLNDYNWREVDIHIPNDLIAEVLGTFDRYNFTVREDDPLDREVAVDPEMLGKVFENLLPENLRKGKGSYYTPRNVVHFMCQESLINYLDGAVNREAVSLLPGHGQQRLIATGEAEQMALGSGGSLVPRADLEEFIRRGEFSQEMDAAKVGGTKSYKYRLPEAIRTHAQELDQELSAIRVCDPAVGSGAFLVRMMHEIVKARATLATYVTGKSPGSPYELKRACIQNCLYGVDIDPGAVDIAKLRLWLSLVVDEEEYKSIHPLPNLDYKVMQGNSLFEDFHGISLLPDQGERSGTLLRRDRGLVERIAKLHKTQAEYFDANHPGEKRKLRADVEDSILEVFAYAIERQSRDYLEAKVQVERKGKGIPQASREKYIAEELTKLQGRLGCAPDELRAELRELTHGNVPRDFFPWRLYFADVFETGGFDVVIANPPYGIDEPAAVRDRFFPECAGGQQNADSYALFIAMALDLLGPNGNISFVVSDTWRTLGSHLPLRRLLLSRSRLCSVLSLPPWVFGATVNTCVLNAVHAPGTERARERNANLVKVCDFSQLPESNKDLTTQVLRQWDDDAKLNVQAGGWRIVEAPCIATAGTSDVPVARYSYRQEQIEEYSRAAIFIASPVLHWVMADQGTRVRHEHIAMSQGQPICARVQKRGGTEVALVNLEQIAEVKVGLQTGDNCYYLRRNKEAHTSYELVDEAEVISDGEIQSLSEDEKKNGVDPDCHGGHRFLPYEKGEKSETKMGWLPNYWVPPTHFIDWSRAAVARMRNLTVAERKRFYNQTAAIRRGDDTRIASRFQNAQYYFRPGVTASRVGIYSPTFRRSIGTVFDSGCSNIISSRFTTDFLLAVLCSKAVKYFFTAFVNHTVNSQVEDLKEIPVPLTLLDSESGLSELAESIIEHQRRDPMYAYQLHEQVQIDKLVYAAFLMDQEDIAEVESWYAREYPHLRGSNPGVP